MTDIKETEMLDEEDEIITLLDENDKEVEFYHIATLDYLEKWYIMLAPVKPMEGMDEDEMFILEIEEDGEGNDTFKPVEDEAILQAVYDEYCKEADEEDEEGCDCDSSCGCGCQEGKPCGCKE